MPAHSPDAVAVVDELVAAGIITPADRDRAVALIDDAGPRATGRTRLVGEISAYVGGVLVFAASSLFVSTQWAMLGAGARAGLVAGAAAVLAVAAGVIIALAHGPRRIRAPRANARRRLAGALLVGAGALAGFAGNIVLTQVLDRQDPRIGALGFGVALAVLLPGYALAPSVVGLLAAAGAWIGVAAALATGPGWAFDEGLFSGLLAGAAVLLVALVERGRLPTRQSGRLVAGGLALVAAQMLVEIRQEAAPAYLALGGLAVLAFVGYALTRAWPHLATGVVAATAGATQAAFDLGEGSLGAAGALLVAGVVLLLTSVIGAAIHRRRDP